MSQFKTVEALESVIRYVIEENKSSRNCGMARRWDVVARIRREFRSRGLTWIPKNSALRMLYEYVKSNKGYTITRTNALIVICRNGEGGD